MRASGIVYSRPLPGCGIVRRSHCWIGSWPPVVADPYADRKSSIETLGEEDVLVGNENFIRVRMNDPGDAQNVVQQGRSQVKG